MTDLKLGLTKYFPETLLQTEIETLIANAEKTLAEYSLFAPKTLTLIGITGAQTDGVILRYTPDVRTNFLALNAGSLRGLDHTELVDVFAETTAKLVAYHTAAVSYASRFKFAVDVPSVAEKIHRGITLKTKAPAGELSEEDLASRYDLRNRVAIGELPKALPAPKVVDVKAVSEIVDASTSGEGAAVGPTITVRTGEFVALHQLAATRTANLNVKVQRDDDVAYLDLAANALPSLSLYESLWIPCLDKMIVTAYGTASSCHVRYAYHICKLDLIRKIKWGLTLTDAEEELARTRDLRNKVRAGIYSL